MQKMWAGRFEEKQSNLFEEINYSIGEDKFLAPWDIEGSKAHAKGLHKIGIFKKEELDAVLSALDMLKNEIEKGDIQPGKDDEDVHMWVERLLTEKVGSLGKKLHTGRSRNDQVVTTARLWMKDAYKRNMGQILNLIECLTELAEEKQCVILPGMTHLQAAQPISLGFYFMAYASKFKRDFLKFQSGLSHLDVMPLGSGALAGANFPLDRGFVAQELEFATASENAMDAVSDRDFVTDYLYLASMVLNHMSSLCEDFILWNSPMVGFVELSDAYSSGSSIMPQKKNPDGFELIRGKAGVMAGRLMSMMSVIKGLPMSYNKDLQEDKAIMQGAYADLCKVLKVLPGMLKTTKYNEDKMLKALKKGYVNATDLADALAAKGMPFRDAHELVGKTVAYAAKEGKALEDLGKEYYKEHLPLPIDEIYEALDYKHCMNNKKTRGGTSSDFVKMQILDMERWLAGRRL